MLSSFSLAPFIILNPVTEIDELQNDNSTKLPSGLFSQTSLIARDQEKGKTTYS